jgi:hypothetical protein
MANTQGLTQETDDKVGENWFDQARILDQEWVELDVTTPRGEKVFYCVPRRTLFQAIDH